MDAERFQQAQELLADAMELPPEERSTFLSARCGGDARLRAEVESLLRSADEAEAFFGDLRERVGGGETALDEAAGVGAGKIQEVLESAIGERYRVESLLARGGMSLVFLAVDRKHGRRVAIKAIHRRADAELGPRFEREIRI
ncbi:MAG TPA: hypothetical protein VK849_10400, partial [Longimicrobiales bacterium]|nr:hypothetical protein [Longimicrobiales bacterium]